MKYIIALLLFLAYTSQLVIGQDSLRNKPIRKERAHDKTYFMYHHGKEYFLEKSKDYKTAAYVLAVGGPVLAISGYLVYQNNKGYNSFNDFWDGLQGTSIGVVMLVAGSVVTVASIPLFIKAEHYKRKSLSISAFLKTEKSPWLTQSNMGYKYFPSLSLKISM